MMEQKKSRKPTRKIGISAFAGALVTVVTYIAKDFGYTIEPEMSASLVTIIVFSFGYLTRD